MIFEHAMFEHERVSQNVEMKSQGYVKNVGLQTHIVAKESYKFADYNLFLAEATIYIRTDQIRYLIFTFMEQTDKYNLYLATN